MATLHSTRGESDDRLPLLSNEEDALEDIAEDIRVEFHQTSRRINGPRSVDDATARSSRGGASFSADNAAPSKRRKKHYSGSEMIVAVFVVAFDTKKG